MKDYRAIIVGAGPAGSATAIHLANLAPEWADRILLVDRAVFPRPKLCGGGVTPRAEAFLEELGVHIDVPSTNIRSARYILGDGFCLQSRKDSFRVVCREDFDEQLFRCAQSRGVQTAEGEQLLDILHAPEGVCVTTTRSRYRSEVVVGADGANSRVRHLSGIKRSVTPPIALEILVPCDSTGAPGFDPDAALFDFGPIARARGAGYCWSFPSIRGSALTLNLGAAFFNPGRNVSQGGETKRIFRDWLRTHGINMEDFDLKGHPIPFFHPAMPLSAPRTLLVGDAAGVEPLMGEGITSALGFGILAAETILDAWTRRDFSFVGYRRRVLDSRVGKMLRIRRARARSFYRDPSFHQIAVMSHLMTGKATMLTATEGT